MVQQILKETVEPKMQEKLPSPIKSMYFETIHLGDQVSTTAFRLLILFIGIINILIMRNEAYACTTNEASMDSLKLDIKHEKAIHFNS